MMNSQRDETRGGCSLSLTGMIRLVVRLLVDSIWSGVSGTGDFSDAVLELKVPGLAILLASGVCETSEASKARWITRILLPSKTYLEAGQACAQTPFLFPFPPGAPAVFWCVVGA
jgi:hypothetical protein